VRNCRTASGCDSQLNGPAIFGNLRLKTDLHYVYLFMKCPIEISAELEHDSSLDAGSVAVHCLLLQCQSPAGSRQNYHQPGLRDCMAIRQTCLYLFGGTSIDPISNPDSTAIRSVLSGYSSRCHCR